MSEAKGDQIVDALLAGSDPDGLGAYQLLQEIFAGYPQANIRRLIHCEDPRAVEAGAWVIDELVDPGEFRDEIDYLISHPVSTARLAGVGLVMESDAREDPGAIAALLRAVWDGVPAVRRRAMRHLATVPQALLEQSSLLVPAEARALAAWLGACASEPGCDHEIQARLSSSSALIRRFAAIAASRLDALHEVRLGARDSDDEDVRAIAGGRQR